MPTAGAEGSVIKILVLGDPATGKSSVIKRYVQDIFSSHHKSTVGVDFALKQLSVDGQVVRLQLWDIAGQDRFGSIARVYYKDAYGVMLVYDVTRPSTFDTVAKWKKEIDSKVTLPNGRPIPVVLLGNKCDKETGAADVAEMDKFCVNNGFIGWFDTSAKTGDNIKEASEFLVRKILTYPDVFEEKRVSQVTFKPGRVLEKDDGGGGGCC